jgi:MFS transporter, DHA2 family, methylenomycin A resistance protein
MYRSADLRSIIVPTQQARFSADTAALAAALLGFFVITLDALVVNVALPSIGRDFGGGMAGLEWVIDTYTLTFAAFLLPAGALSDRIGARRAFGIGLGLFVAASAACGLATDLNVLILGRLAQGAGAALIMPTSLALIRHAYSDSVERGRAIALWAVGGAVASAAGPLAGGVATLVTWRSIFFINLPVGLVALLFLLRVAPSPRRIVPIDWVAQTAAVVAMAAATYGLVEGGSSGFGATEVVIALLVALVAGIVFVVTQQRGRHPMVPFHAFRSRPTLVPLAVGFAFMVGFYGMVFVLSLYLQQVRGLSPLETGLVFLPMTAFTAFLNPVAARLAERFGARVPIVTGLFAMAAGLFAIVLMPVGAPVAVLALLMIPVSLGGPLAMPPATAVLLESVPQHLAGTASGVLNTGRQLGGAIAVAVFGALVASSAGFEIGLRASLLIAGIVVLAAAVASLLLRSRTATTAVEG